MTITAGSDIVVEDLFHIRNVDCVADENITIGQPLGISNNVTGLKVARALRMYGTATIGYTMESDTAQKNSLTCPIGGDKFVFVGTQLSDDSLYATVGTVAPSTKTATVGTPVAATADIANSTDYYAVCKLDTDKFIVFYREDASTLIVKCRVATVSGTVITFGAAATFFTGATASDGIVCDQIGTDKGVVFIHCATGSDSRLVAFTVATTTVTAGTPKALGTTIDDNIASAGAIKKIGTDKFILACATGGATSNLCQVGTISGTTITLGTETAWSTSDNLYANMYIVSPATDVAVIQGATGSQIPIIVACTVSGTTPTFGAEIAGEQYDGSMYTESATSILVANGGNENIKKYTLSGNTLTYFGLVFQRITSANPKTFIPMDNSYWITILATTTTLFYTIQGMSNNFLGIAQSTVSKGATVSVMTQGIDANQSGLVPGGSYSVLNGVLTFVTSQTAMNTVDDYFVLALSATQIKLNR